MAQPYVGEIRMFAGDLAPAGWMLAYHEFPNLLLRQFPDLFIRYHPAAIFVPSIRTDRKRIMADPFVAEIRIFPFTFAPTGWAWCDGQILPISQNTALFSLLGT